MHLRKWTYQTARRMAPRNRPLTPLSFITSRATVNPPFFVTPFWLASFSRDWPCCLAFSTSFIASFSEFSAVADNIMRVLTTSTGVVRTAAMEPALPALTAVARAVSPNPPVYVPFFFLRSMMSSFICSNIGNCIAVKGRFRAASAVYPLNNWEGFLNCLKAWRVTDG